MTTYIIGNLDGVHRGHQALITVGETVARRLDGSLAALTFEPHPRQVFAPEKSAFRLTTPAQKRALLGQYGVAQMEVVPFSRTFAQQPATAFTRELLAGKLGAKAVIIGEDFRFGHDREGDIALLRAEGEELGFEVHAVPAVKDESGQPYSSTRVRSAIQEADFTLAEKLLGHPWQFEGEVFQGQQLGRTISIPTANILLGDYQRFPYGIYAARVGIGNAPVTRPAAAYLGRRPTLNGEPEWFEAHLLDFDQDIYGQKITVELVQFLRGDMKFEGLDDLLAQMNQDIGEARALLKA